VLPKEIISEIPYKPVYKALKDGDEEEFNRLIRDQFVKKLLKEAYQATKSQEHHKGMKQRFQGLIYLHLLLAVYRMPNHITVNLEDISAKLGIPFQVAENIFTEFTQISQNQDKQFQDGEKRFKYVKTKQHVAKLICHIIAIMCHLSYDTIRASTIGKELKMDTRSLFEYFKEVNAKFKAVEQADGKKDDFVVGFKGGDTPIKKKK